MPQLINLGTELLRIDTAKNTIEFSQTGGRSWVTRCNSTSYGTFILHQQGVVCLSKQRALFLAPMHKHIILRRLHLPTTEWQRTAGKHHQRSLLFEK